MMIEGGVFCTLFLAVLPGLPASPSVWPQPLKCGTLALQVEELWVTVFRFPEQSTSHFAYPLRNRLSSPLHREGGGFRLVYKYSETDATLLRVTVKVQKKTD